jgi:hypothetical protein
MTKTFIFLISILSPAITTAQQSDITFIVAGKTSNHLQQLDGSIQTLNFHFFAEIFLQPDGIVSPARIRTAMRTRQVDFSDSDYALEMHGGRYKTEEELEENYPDGDYVFHYATPSIGSVSQTVVMNNTRSSGSGLPAAPKIYLSQAGQAVPPDQVDPDLDLYVSWSDFSEGRKDPLGIVDDLLFVIMANCHGERVAHSGRPFENIPFLTYADDSYVIAKGILNAENAYQLSVEHAILDTSMEHGVPAIGTFATTTFLELKTTGSAIGNDACPTILENFDSGQTIL